MHITPRYALLIRKTHEDDLPYLDAIFDTCRAYMVEQGNPTQWDSNYPTSKVVAEDIKNGTGYVCVKEITNEILATFCVSDYEAEYEHLRDGNWSADRPYTVIHRMASLPGSGAGQFIFNQLMQEHEYIRIDTHADNCTMLHILQKLGFRYCGLVTYEGYGDRVCFDYLRDDK